MIRIFVLVVLVLIMTGCACFPRNNLPQVTNLPIIVVGLEKPTVHCEFSYETNLWARKDAPTRNGSTYKYELDSVLMESGYFGSIVEKTYADVIIDVTLFISGSRELNIARAITGLTAYAIPSWGSTTITANAKVNVRNGKEFIYRLEDNVSEVDWLPLIVLPFGCSEWGMNVPKKSEEIFGIISS